MVPRTRLELVRFTPHAPQTCAATNYATSARKLKNIRLAGNLFICRIFALTYLRWRVGICSAAVFAFRSVAITVFAFVSTFAFAFASTSALASGATAVSFSCRRQDLLSKPKYFRSKRASQKQSRQHKSGCGDNRDFRQNRLRTARLKAVLETLLVKSAPASVFPG